MEVQQEAVPAPGAAGFRPDIEGLRAVAIILVVLFHAGVPAVAGGYIGVDVFFVLSGYLITGIVQREMAKTGGLSFLGFYARRARRLMPASALVLLVTLVGVVLVVSPMEVHTYASSAAAVSVYASNIFFAAKATDYLAVANDGNPFLQTWSLTVEEQFYFVWPALLLVLFLIGRRLRRPVTLKLGLGLLALGSFAACVAMTQIRQPWAFFLVPFRFWEFAIGGLAGLIAWPRLTGSRARPWLGGIGLLAIVGSALLFDESTTFPGALVAVPVLATVAVLISGSGSATGGPTAGLLGWSPMQWFGRHSYSWYLWHWPLLVLVLARYPGTGTWARLGVVTVALGISALTFVALERPVRESAWLRARPWLSVGGGLGLAGICLVASLGVGRYATSELNRPEQQRIVASATDRPAIYADGCLAGFEVTEPNEGCTYGDPDGDRTIVLFGDSHAGNLATALDVAGKEHGWRIETRLKASCASIDLPTYPNPRLGGPYSECTQWRQRVMDEIEADPPDLVVTSNLVEYVHGDEAEWRSALERTATTLDEASIPLLAVSDIPTPGVNVPFCLSKAASTSLLPTSDCSFDRDSAPNHGFPAIDRRAMEGSRHGEALDLSDAVCPEERCEVDRDGTIVFSDSNHLTATFSATLADLMAAEIEPLLTAR